MICETQFNSWIGLTINCWDKKTMDFNQLNTEITHLKQIFMKITTHVASRLLQYVFLSKYQYWDYHIMQKQFLKSFDYCMKII